MTPHTGPATRSRTTRTSPATRSSKAPRTLAALEFHGLTKTFTVGRAQPVPAVRGIDLRVDAGEVVALLGPNGAGKTTAIDLALGLTEPSSGRVEVFGSSPRRAVADGRISAVLQTGGLLSDLTVYETVRAIAALYKNTLGVGEVLDRAGLSGIADRRVGRCSGGEQQRLRFALALLPDPDLLILDEPTAAMDIATRREFWSTMHAEASSGSTILFATHHMEEAESFADRIVLMARGRIVADGPVDRIRSMTSGSTVTAVWSPTESEPAPEELPGVTAVERTAARVILTSTRSDDTARALLTRTAAHDVTITARSLDDAFLALTADDAHDAVAPDTADPETDR